MEVSKGKLHIVHENMSAWGGEGAVAVTKLRIAKHFQ